MPVIVLTRPDNSTAWGFRLHGGKDFGSPLTVQRINPGSIAAKCGLLIGDLLLKINSIPAADLKHREAQDLIAKGGNNVELTIDRGEEENLSSFATRPAEVTNNNGARSPGMSPVTSYGPRPYLSQASASSTYGSKVDKLTSDTASLNVSKTSDEVSDRPKWEAPMARGISKPPVGGYNSNTAGSETKKYVPSETCKLVRDMEAGSEASYSPRTGAEKRPVPAQSKLVGYLDKTCSEKNPPAPMRGSPSHQSPMLPAQSNPVPAWSRAPVAPGAATASAQRPGVTPTSGFKVPSSSAGGRKTHLEEALSMPAFAGGTLPVCNVDNLPIKGPYVTAVNKIWCQEHFVCSNPSCRQSLADSGFVEEDGQLFCKSDYEAYFAPRCAKCQQPIIGDTVKALQQTYHPSCFSCRHCKQPIMGGIFHLQEGEPYCEKDWAALFQSKCFGCQFPIELGDTWIEALGQNWHGECFNCTTCHVNLEGQGFVNRGGRPYCKNHARP